MNDQFIFTSKIENLESVMKWIRELSCRAGFDSYAIKKIELGMEEAIVNIIHHAYPNEEGIIEIIACLHQGKSIEFKLKDYGPAFNPLLKISAVDPSLSLDERKEGGLGIVMMRKYMDELYYERCNFCNVLTLIKKMSV